MRLWFVILVKQKVTRESIFLDTADLLSYEKREKKQHSWSYSGLADKKAIHYHIIGNINTVIDSAVFAAPSLKPKLTQHTSNSSFQHQPFFS